ncbi:MAG TPA: hypothetical protein VJ777_21530 [Mycobacterium sp.]|nr:hypothetical protein [Mycobacterium sp.]
MWSGTALTVVVLVIVALWAVPIVGTLALLPGAARTRRHGGAGDDG